MKKKEVQVAATEFKQQAISNDLLLLTKSIFELVKPKAPLSALKKALASPEAKLALSLKNSENNTPLEAMLIEFTTGYAVTDIDEFTQKVQLLVQNGSIVSDETLDKWLRHQIPNYEVPSCRLPSKYCKLLCYLLKTFAKPWEKLIQLEMQESVIFGRRLGFFIHIEKIVIYLNELGPFPWQGGGYSFRGLEEVFLNENIGFKLIYTILLSDLSPLPLIRKLINNQTLDINSLERFHNNVSVKVFSSHMPILQLIFYSHRKKLTDVADLVRFLLDSGLTPTVEHLEMIKNEERLGTSSSFQNSWKTIRTNERIAYELILTKITPQYMYQNLDRAMEILCHLLSYQFPPERLLLLIKNNNRSEFLKLINHKVPPEKVTINSIFEIERLIQKDLYTAIARSLKYVSKYFSSSDKICRQSFQYYLDFIKFLLKNKVAISGIAFSSFQTLSFSSEYSSQQTLFIETIRTIINLILKDFDYSNLTDELLICELIKRRTPLIEMAKIPKIQQIFSVTNPIAVACQEWSSNPGDPYFPQVIDILISKIPANHSALSTLSMMDRPNINQAKKFIQQILDSMHLEQLCQYPQEGVQLIMKVIQLQQPLIPLLETKVTNPLRVAEMLNFKDSKSDKPNLLEVAFKLTDLKYSLPIIQRLSSLGCTLRPTGIIFLIKDSDLEKANKIFSMLLEYSIVFSFEDINFSKSFLDLMIHLKRPIADYEKIFSHNSAAIIKSLQHDHGKFMAKIISRSDYSFGFAGDYCAPLIHLLLSHGVPYQYNRTFEKIITEFNSNSYPLKIDIGYRAELLLSHPQNRLPVGLHTKTLRRLFSSSELMRYYAPKLKKTITDGLSLSLYPPTIGLILDYIDEHNDYALNALFDDLNHDDITVLEVKSQETPDICSAHALFNALLPGALLLSELPLIDAILAPDIKTEKHPRQLCVDFIQQSAALKQHLVDGTPDMIMAFFQKVQSPNSEFKRLLTDSKLEKVPLLLDTMAQFNGLKKFQVLQVPIVNNEGGIRIGEKDAVFNLEMAALLGHFNQKLRAGERILYPIFFGINDSHWLLFMMSGNKGKYKFYVMDSINDDVEEDQYREYRLAITPVLNAGESEISTYYSFQLNNALQEFQFLEFPRVANILPELAKDPVCNDFSSYTLLIEAQDIKINIEEPLPPEPRLNEAAWHQKFVLIHVNQQDWYFYVKDPRGNVRKNYTQKRGLESLHHELKSISLMNEAAQTHLSQKIRTLLQHIHQETAHEAPQKLFIQCAALINFLLHVAAIKTNTLWLQNNLWRLSNLPKVIHFYQQRCEVHFKGEILQHLNLQAKECFTLMKKLTQYPPFQDLLVTKTYRSELRGPTLFSSESRTLSPQSTNSTFHMG